MSQSCALLFRTFFAVCFTSDCCVSSVFIQPFEPFATIKEHLSPQHCKMRLKGCRWCKCKQFTVKSLSFFLSGGNKHSNTCCWDVHGCWENKKLREFRCRVIATGGCVNQALPLRRVLITTNTQSWAWSSLSFGITMGSAGGYPSCSLLSSTADAQSGWGSLSYSREGGGGSSYSPADLCLEMSSGMKPSLWTHETWTAETRCCKQRQRKPPLPLQPWPKPTTGSLKAAGEDQLLGMNC